VPLRVTCTCVGRIAARLLVSTFAKLCKHGGPIWLPVVSSMLIWSLLTSSVRPAGALCDGPGMPVMQRSSTVWHLSMRSTYDTHSTFTGWWLHRLHRPNPWLGLLAMFNS